MSKILYTFWHNQIERETVKAFLLETLAKIAVEKTFAGESVNGIADAKKLIDKAFDELETTYATIETPKHQSSR